MKRILWAIEIVASQLSIFHLPGVPVSSLHISLNYLYSNHMKILTSRFHKWGNWGKFLEASITCLHFITQVNTYYQQTCHVIKKFLEMALLNSRRRQIGTDRKTVLALIIFFIFPQPEFQKLKLSFWSRTG